MGTRKSISNTIKYTDGDVKNSLDMFYGIQLDEEQKIFRDTIWDSNKLIVFCNSRAGTGKTLVSVGTANLLYQYGKYSKIVYIISPTMEQKQGYIPGSIEDKSAPYMEPLYDAVSKIGLNPEQVIDNEDNISGKKMGTAFITCRPHTFLRGCNLEDSIVIIEECQNYYTDELKKTISRISDTSKTIIIGHDGQCDLLKHPENSGFVKAIELFKSKNDDRVGICELKNNHRGWVSSVADEL